MRFDFFLAESAWKYVLRTIAGLLLFFLFMPLVVVIPMSFTSEPFFTFPIPGWSTRWYEELYASSDWRHAAYASIVIALPVTVIATALGVLASLGLTLASFRGKALVIGLILSPMMVPHIIIGVGMFFLYSPLGLVGTLGGMILAHITLALPFVVLVVTATLANFNVNVMHAGANLGANPVEVFFKIVLPLILPGVLAGAILAFIHSFDELIVAILISGADYKTIPRQMWSGAREELSPVITAAATILIAFSFLIMGTAEVLRRRAERLRSARFARA